MKTYNMNLTSGPSPDAEGSRGFVTALKQGMLRAVRRHFAADDPYCLRRRLLRTVLKRIAVLALLALPSAGALYSVHFHPQPTSAHSPYNLRAAAAR